MKAPGGGDAIRFPIVPPKTLLSVSYLAFGVPPLNTILSYVGSEEGQAKHIPVMLQRIYSKWALIVVQILLVAGLWVVVNVFLSLVQFLLSTYYL